MAEFSTVVGADCPCHSLAWGYILCTETEKTGILMPFSYGKRAAKSGFFRTL